MCVSHKTSVPLCGLWWCLAVRAGGCVWPLPHFILLVFRLIVDGKKRPPIYVRLGASARGLLCVCCHQASLIKTNCQERRQLRHTNRARTTVNTSRRTAVAILLALAPLLWLFVTCTARPNGLWGDARPDQTQEQSTTIERRIHISRLRLDWSIKHTEA